MISSHLFRRSFSSKGHINFNLLTKSATTYMHKNNWLVTESKKENLIFLEKSISSGNPLVVIWFQGRGVLHIPEDEAHDPNI